MKILYIEHYAGSDKYGMEFRPYYFAKNWVKSGHEVYIIAGSFSHLRIKNPVVKKDFQEENIDGIHYIWLKTVSYKGNKLGRILNVGQFLSKLNKNACWIAKKFSPDVVIASSTYPMDTYPAQKISRLSNAVLIHEVHDMWPITPMELYHLSNNNPMIRYIQRAEDSFCKNSDVVLSLFPNADKYFIKHGMKPEAFASIPNGIIKEEWPDNPDINPKIKNNIDKIRKKYKKIICFFGSHTVSYSLDYFIKAANECKDLSIAFLLVGDGTYKQELKILANSMNLKSVFFMGSVPKKDIPGLLSLVDGIYIGAKNNKMFRFGICMNKLFDALASGKPIIFAADVPNNYIKQYKCGIPVKAENLDDLVAAIKKFDMLDDSELKKMGENGRNACMEYFEYEKLSEKFLEIMENAIIKKRGENK